MQNNDRKNRVDINLKPLLDHVPIIAKAIENASADPDIKKNTEYLMTLYRSKDVPSQISCINATLTLAVSFLSKNLLLNNKLLEKENNRLKGKEESDAEKQEDAKRKIKEALRDLSREKKKPTILEIRFKINELFGDAGQRSAGNLMLSNPEYHMSATTIRRYLKRMPSVIEDFFPLPSNGTPALNNGE